MPGGTSVRDIDAQKFIVAYSAFLKRQAKLPIPGTFSPYVTDHAPYPPDSSLLTFSLSSFELALPKRTFASPFDIMLISLRTTGWADTVKERYYPELYIPLLLTIFKDLAL